MKILLFKTHPINITNLVIAQTVQNSTESFFEPCRYELVHGKFFYLKSGNFAEKFGEIRTADWSHNLSYIDSCLQSGKTLIFGTHHDSQIRLLKETYGSDILTIGINYEEDLYSLLLNNMAEYHLHLMGTGDIQPSENDEILLETLNSHELIRYYANEFDAMKLIPRSSFIDCDYNISVNDFFDKSKMSDHFINMGFPFTEESQKYYDQWLSSNSFSSN